MCLKRRRNGLPCLLPPYWCKRCQNEKWAFVPSVVCVLLLSQTDRQSDVIPQGTSVVGHRFHHFFVCSSPVPETDSQISSIRAHLFLCLQNYTGNILVCVSVCVCVCLHSCYVKNYSIIQATYLMSAPHKLTLVFRLCSRTKSHTQQHGWSIGL